MCWLSSYCFGEIFVSRHDGVTGVFLAVSVDTECPKTRLNILLESELGLGWLGSLTMTTAFWDSLYVCRALLRTCRVDIYYFLL